MTLIELYELVDELLSEFEETTPVKIYNPITDSFEEFSDITPVQVVDDDGNDVEDEEFLSISSDQIEMDFDSDDEEDKAH